jgi:hypothetical protein
MALGLTQVDGLIGGSLVGAREPFPIVLTAEVGDLRARFLYKGQPARGHHYIARNGHVLLVARLPLAELIGRAARVRLQKWHRAILAGDRPTLYGVLLWMDAARAPVSGSLYRMRLEKTGNPLADLTLDVGGGLVLMVERCSSKVVSLSKGPTISQKRHEQVS